MCQPTAIATIVLGLSATLMALPAQAQNLPPCAQIRAACEQAGFVQGAVRDGYGLQIDCIRPILQGVPQPPRATMPLPPVDPGIVAACRQRMASGPANVGRPNVASAGVPPCGPDQPPLPPRHAPNRPAEPDQAPQRQDQPGQQSPPQSEPQQ
jgi:hypothetical protein